MKENNPGDWYKQHVRRLFIPLLHEKCIRLETGLNDIDRTVYEII